MKTLWSKQLRPDRVLQEYPRPQMRRAEYTVLNGLWDYAFTASESQPGVWEGTGSVGRRAASCAWMA